MENEKIVLQKGESIKFLDYTIKNSSNNDGLVLFKEGYIGYESHLGNYGTGTQENIDTCKKFAILYFMAARPHEFATTLVQKAIRQNNGGTYMEFYGFKNVLDKEGFQMPEDITAGDVNAFIYFKGKPITI